MSAKKSRNAIVIYKQYSLVPLSDRFSSHALPLTITSFLGIPSLTMHPLFLLLLFLPIPPFLLSLSFFFVRSFLQSLELLLILVLRHKAQNVLFVIFRNLSINIGLFKFTRREHGLIIYNLQQYLIHSIQRYTHFVEMAFIWLRRCTSLGSTFLRAYSFRSRYFSSKTCLDWFSTFHLLTLPRSRQRN